MIHAASDDEKSDDTKPSFSHHFSLFLVQFAVAYCARWDVDDPVQRS